MAPMVTKNGVPENQPESREDRQKLIETFHSLVAKMDGTGGGEPQSEKSDESPSNLENILALGAKPLSQSPLIDQLVDELHQLKNSTAPTLSAPNQWKRLAGIEENIIHVVANIGYDILSSIDDVHSKVAALVDARHDGGSPRKFALDPKYSKPQSIIKYMQFLQQIPGCEGECLCRTVETDTKAPCQHLDQPLHFGSPVPLYEVCPIEILLKSFEGESTLYASINFSAAASYTNFVSSIFIPNYGPVPVQIPWISDMQNVNVIGKVTAEMQVSKASVPITFLMNVIDWTDNGNRVVILGRDFVAKYVQSVHHDTGIVIMKDPVELTYEKRFVYLRRVLREVETTFCRYQLKKEVKDVNDVQARIDRLQRVLEQHPKPLVNAERPDLNSQPENILKACDEVDDPQSSQVSNPKSPKDGVENVISLSQKGIVEDVRPVVPKDLPKDVKLSQPKSSQQASSPKSSKDGTENLTPFSWTRIAENVCSVVLKDVQEKVSQPKSSQQATGPKSSKDGLENVISFSRTRIVDVGSVVPKDQEDLSSQSKGVQQVLHAKIPPSVPAGKPISLDLMDVLGEGFKKLAPLQDEKPSDSKKKKFFKSSDFEKPEPQDSTKGDVEKAALAAGTEHMKINSRKHERKATYFHPNLTAFEEENSKRPVVERGENTCVDPARQKPPASRPRKVPAEETRRSPPVIRTKEQKVNENGEPPSKKLEEDQKENLVVTVENPSSKRPKIVEKEPKPQQERMVKPALKNVIKDEYSIRSLVPSSVIKNLAQENPTSKSSTEVISKPLETPQDTDEKPDFR